MHSEVKNIASGLLAVVLLPVSYVVIFYGMFKIGLNISIEGIMISLIGIVLAVTGEIVH